MSTCKIDFLNEWTLKYQGAESQLYFGTHVGNKCVIKYRFSKKYRHPVLDKKLTKERTKRERRIIDKIRSKSELLGPYMPKVAWSDDCTILMSEICNCESLFDFFERDTDDCHKLAPMIGQCVAELHNLSIIHGDLTTSNLLMVPKADSSETTKKIKLADMTDVQNSFMVIPIDFGLATGSMHPEERAVDLYVLERALLSTHFTDSSFFNQIFKSYLDHIIEPLGKNKIIERLRDVRARGRKSDYADDNEG